MRILDCYIGRYVFLSMLGVLFAVVMLESLFSFFAQLDDRRADYMLFDVALYVAALIPRKIHEYMPVCCMIGCMVGLSPLVSGNELTAIRSMGVPLWRIIFSIMKPAFFMMFSALFLGEYIVPDLVEKANTKRAMARAGDEVYQGDGMWYREGDSFFYFSAVDPAGELRGVSRYDFNGDKNFLGSSYAQNACLTDRGWVFKNIRMVSFKDGVLHQEVLEQLPWTTSLTKDFLKTAVMDPWGMSLSGLRVHGNYLKEQGLNSDIYNLVFWTKCFRPVSVFALVLIGIVLMIGVFRTGNIGVRLFSGILVGIVFMLVQNLLGPAGLVFGIPPFLATSIPVFIVLIIGSVLLNRIY